MVAIWPFLNVCQKYNGWAIWLFLTFLGVEESRIYFGLFGKI